jgi:hypothetical protein
LCTPRERRRKGKHPEQNRSLRKRRTDHWVGRRFSSRTVCDPERNGVFWELGSGN